MSEERIDMVHEAADRVAVAFQQLRAGPRAVSRVEFGTTCWDQFKALAGQSDHDTVRGVFMGVPITLNERLEANHVRVFRQSEHGSDFIYHADVVMAQRIVAFLALAEGEA